MVVPGPAALGRGVVVNAGDPIPAPWAAAPVVVVDEAVLRDPADVVARLHQAWGQREPVVIELGVDPTRFRTPETFTDPLWSLGAAFEPWYDRLHFLVWNNTYDGRAGGLRWWWGAKAARLAEGADEIRAVEDPGDVRLPDGTAVWVDGGPRRPWARDEVDGLGVVHHDSVELGSLAVVPAPVEPTADLAPDQLAAVAHLSGPARIIAPAGSGKTRVLTERLRHLLGDRGYERESVLAVAYNKQAQLELQARTEAFRPQVRTLNSLGLWILGEYHGRLPTTIDERDVRAIVEKVAPVRRQRRANTDPIGPYVEALSLARLGLVEPRQIEVERDDVPGFAETFDGFRKVLRDRGVVDFDEQVYGAIELLLADGAFRRELQGRCRHLLVDEFQDLTQAHVLLIRLLALPTLDVFGVGDDDQTIYGHATADPQFLVHYDRLVPGAASHPLTVNYRCPVAIVDGARTLLGYNRQRVDKDIHAGPAAEVDPRALRIVQHQTEDAASSVVEVVRGWLAEPGVDPGSIAVLARVNSILLPPHVALHEAGVPIASTLHPDVLNRTGLRAALAYLRIATSPNAIDPADVNEVLRRPSRGLPQWFPERLQQRKQWTTKGLRGIADRVSEKDAPKVHRLVDDLEAVLEAGVGSTRLVLETVRDKVGLGSAMGLLDRTGGGQAASHLDDLEGLIGVADLHPDPAGFEPWLRQAFQREVDPTGVTLSTIHRVKGREWDRVVVFGVLPGIVPHRLADDVEEERRVLHVAITRGRDRVAVLTDRANPSRFLAELAGTAPKRELVRSRSAPEPAAGAEVVSLFAKRSKPKPTVDPGADGIEAVVGVVITALGGYEGAVESIGAIGAKIRLANGGLMTIKWGERIEHEGRKAPLVPPTTLEGPQAAAEAALREYRAERSKAEGVPAYVVLSDKHLRGIAIALPTSMKELAACDGIGPAKLEKYGDDLIEIIEGAVGA